MENILSKKSINQSVKTFAETGDVKNSSAWRLAAPALKVLRLAQKIATVAEILNQAIALQSTNLFVAW